MDIEVKKMMKIIKRDMAGEVSYHGMTMDERAHVFTVVRERPVRLFGKWFKVQDTQFVRVLDGTWACSLIGVYS